LGVTQFHHNKWRCGVEAGIKSLRGGTHHGDKEKGCQEEKEKVTA